jgi:hypothetical protein
MHTFQAAFTNKQFISQAAAEDTKPIFLRCPDKLPRVFKNWGLLCCRVPRWVGVPDVSKELVTGIFK